MQKPTPLPWALPKKTGFRFCFVFVLLFINSFSFPHQFIPDAGKYSSPYFEKLAAWTASHLLPTRQAYTTLLISDSTGLYIHTLNLFIITIIIVLVWGYLDRKRPGYNQLCYFFFVYVRYYLAMQLFLYGFSKVFKWQFYTPEPNTIFTPLGRISRDLLYWSLMGVSRSFTIFAGIIEIVAGSLLLYRRTMLSGALLAFAAMLNVVAVNFSFDISVKLYSLFLLMLCLVLLAPYLRSLFAFFFLGIATEYPSPKGLWFKNKPGLYHAIKTLAIALIIADTAFIYFSTGNFNDDKYPRPFLHGAYDVQQFIKNNDTLPPLLTDPVRWRRVFIHRRGYFITQLMDDEMTDYKLDYDTTRKELVLSDYDSSQAIFHYELLTDSTLLLNGKATDDSLTIFLKKIDLSKLPLLKQGFSWTTDE